MKKLSFFAAALLMLGFTACTEIDNPFINDGRTTITLDGVNYKSDLVGTFTGEVGAEVSLKLGVYENYGIYGVDFGDGVIVTDTVGCENGGVKGEDGLTKVGTKHTGTTEFKGTISGEGIVKVYGNQKLWYLICSGGILPTSFDQEKLADLVQVTISGVEVDGLDLKGLDLLEQFNFTQGSISSINVADNPSLTSLTINNNSASKFESKLTSLDVSNNTSLEYLNVMGASKDKPGLLTTLDLSNNTALTKLYAQYNKLTSIKLPDGADISFLNVQNNELTELDLSKVGSVLDIYASDNKLTAIDLSKLAAKAKVNLYNNNLTKLTVPVDVNTLRANNNKISEVSIKNVTNQLALENNELTFSALPALPAGLATKVKKYTYAPQNVTIPVTISAGAIDLSKEYGPFQGITDAKDKLTNIVFKADGADMPAENYKLDGGKANFLHVYNVVYAELTNPAFPDLTLETAKFALSFGTPVLYETLFTYDFAAAAAAGENPSNVNGSKANGHALYGWEDDSNTDKLRQSFKGYSWADGSILPKECHVWRMDDRINGNLKDGGLQFPNDKKQLAIDGLEPGYMVEVFYDATNVSDENAKELIWACGTGTSEGGPGKDRATATINGTDAIIGETTVPSGAGIVVKSVTPAENGTGYIILRAVKKGMVLTKVIISKPQ